MEVPVSRQWMSDFQCLFVFCPYREVVTFNHFLEAAAEKEVQGKARLHDFIENLLQRVELAEKQLEYYQSQQASGFSRDASEHVVSPTQPSSGCSPLSLVGMDPEGAKIEERGALIHKGFLGVSVSPGPGRASV